MRGRGQVKALNAWEAQFYQKLWHGHLEDGEVPVLDEWISQDSDSDRYALLEASLRQALVDTERTYSD